MTSTAAVFQHAFATRDFSAVAGLLADDVVFRSPVLHEHWRTRSVVEHLGPAMVGVFDSVEFGPVAEQGRRELLPFAARPDGLEVEGILLVDTREDGLVSDLAIFLRPLTAVQAVAKAMAAALGH